MLSLVNTNRMVPPIAPIGVDYLASATTAVGIPTEVLDLGLADRPEEAISRHFSRGTPRLVGLSFRNVDDCFWPRGEWFVPGLVDLVETLRRHTDAPIVLGGVGYSMDPARILEASGADFGVHGDGEPALRALFSELEGSRDFRRVPGLLWREGSRLLRNPPSWEAPVLLQTRREFVDNREYFRRGGQGGVETKRGCGRPCVYCADPIAKGRSARLRPPGLVADEIECLIAQGVDVIHLCDSEFNLPRAHAVEVCEEIVRRGLERSARWYAYLTVKPFDVALAALMRRAGCVGINFGTDSASDRVLEAYRQTHRKEDVRVAIELCRAEGIRVMIDLLLGGPGETPETVGETISFLKEAGPDAVGAPVGVRLYPDTAVVRIIEREAPLDAHPGIRRSYRGPVDLFRPTFYIAPSLGERPGELVRDRIGADSRFFPPGPEVPERSASEQGEDSSHNYNANRILLEAIRDGARGAYWDILRERRSSV